MVDFPLFEETLRRAYGVVTHSEFFRKRVQQVYAGPLARLSLPYDAVQGSPSLTRASLKIPKEHVLLVTVGHVNPNKRIHSVIKVLAGNPALRGRLTYAILGSHGGPYYQQLVALVAKSGMESAVRFLGYASDEVFQAYSAHADIFVNLRFPAIEGASASVIEEMLCGKPVIVTDTGFYNELPGECVWKINPAREEEDLSAAFQRLTADAAVRSQLGTQAQEYALRALPSGPVRQRISAICPGCPRRQADPSVDRQTG